MEGAVTAADFRSRSQNIGDDARVGAFVARRPWYSTIEGLQEHLSNGAVEDYETEFKRGTKLTDKTPEFQKEFRKDVSAMANASGGVVIIGVSPDLTCEGYVLDPIPSVNQDAEVRRLQQYLDQLDPRLTDVSFHWLSVNTIESVLVVEVGKSFHGPHQNSDGAFYYRDGGRVTQMKQKQLAHEFTGGARRAAALRQLRQERMAMAESGEGLPAITGPHLMIRLHGVEEQAIDVPRNTITKIRPIAADPMNTQVNIDGLIIHSVFPDRYVAVLRTGCVEWHCAPNASERTRSDKSRPAVHLENLLVNLCHVAAHGAVQWLRAQGVKGPLILSADIAAVHSHTIYSDSLEWIPDEIYLRRRFDRTRIMIPEILFDDRDLGLPNALAALCAEIWRAAGHEAPPECLSRDALIRRLAPTARE